MLTVYIYYVSVKYLKCLYLGIHQILKRIDIVVLEIIIIFWMKNRLIVYIPLFTFLYKSNCIVSSFV